MPFGAKNAPATFQRMIDNILAPAHQFCRAFMDDGVIWANTMEDIVARTRTVFALIRDAGLRVKLKKCEFFKNSISYLGHIIGQHGISTHPPNCKAYLTSLCLAPKPTSAPS